MKLAENDIPHKKAFQAEQYKRADLRMRKAILEAWLIYSVDFYGVHVGFKRYQII